MSSAARPSTENIRVLLQQVKDPEIPVLNITDLGVLRDVRWEQDTLVVVITPTYSGCPAMQAIEDDIVSLLSDQGIDNVRVQTQLAPAWTTDWLSQRARQKLQSVGIAPPRGCAQRRNPFAAPDAVPCPRCGATNTAVISEFGSTACKALYRCEACLEPFDYFKCH